jgi:hypothetical protein|tara:strand:- start:63 stop:245 length:183 start_codon:yes stop_codon:yes gene_type:complete
MSQDQTQMATIEVNTLNEVLKYLSERPYQEVAQLVSKVHRAQIVEDKPVMAEKPKVTKKK